MRLTSLPPEEKDLIRYFARSLDEGRTTLPKLDVIAAVPAAEKNWDRSIRRLTLYELIESVTTSRDATDQTIQTITITPKAWSVNQTLEEQEAEEAAPDVVEQLARWVRRHKRLGWLLVIVFIALTITEFAANIHEILAFYR